MNLTSQMSMMLDRRRMRAEIVAHHVLIALEPWIERLDRLEAWNEQERKAEGSPAGRPKTRRDIYRSLFDLLYVTGAEVITDADRAMAGLEPRNERGLTETELRIMEDRMTEAMLKPTALFGVFEPGV